MEKGDFLKKLKESLETGQENNDVKNLHYDILKQAGQIKINPETNEIIKRETPKSVANEKKDNELHAKALNEYLETDAVAISNLGNIVPVAEVNVEKKNQDDQNVKVRYEILLLENEITMLQATIVKNREFIDFLKTQIR